MKLREFTLEVPGRGKVDVEFYLHFDNTTTSAREIKIHTDFDSGIPHKVQLKMDGGRWKLFAEHPVKQDGEITVLPEFLNDEISLAVADRIYNYVQND